MAMIILKMLLEQSTSASNKITMPGNNISNRANFSFRSRASMTDVSAYGSFRFQLEFVKDSKLLGVQIFSRRESFMKDE